MDTLGIRLKKLRLEKNITQKGLAAMLGISLRGYQLYESDDGYPGVPGLISLADYFDVSLDYLVGRSNEPARR